MRSKKTNPRQSIVKKLHVIILTLFVVTAFQGCDNYGSGTASRTTPVKRRIS
jgi:hypothetical protein